MAITPIVILSFVLYSAITGFVYQKALSRVKNKCGCSHRRRCSIDHEFGAAGTAVFWPLAAPAIVGTMIAAREPREVRKRRKQLEIQAHIERIERELDIR